MVGLVKLVLTVGLLVAILASCANSSEVRSRTVQKDDIEVLLRTIGSYPVTSDSLELVVGSKDVEFDLNALNSLLEPIEDGLVFTVEELRAVGGSATVWEASTLISVAGIDPSTINDIGRSQFVVFLDGDQLHVTASSLCDAMTAFGVFCSLGS